MKVVHYGHQFFFAQQFIQTIHNVRSGIFHHMDSICLMFSKHLVGVAIY